MVWGKRFSGPWSHGSVHTTAVVLGIVFSLFYCCDNLTSVRRTPFPIRVTTDSTVTIRDTLKIKVSVAEASVWGVRYIWFIDSPLLSDTTSDSMLLKVFSAADTGNHLIVIKAIDRNGLESPLDSLRVNVIYHRPAVTIHADTTVPVHASYSFRIAGTAGDSRILHYIWYIDDSLRSRTTSDILVTWVWGVADTGRHVITVHAIDSDGIASFPASLSVRVSCSHPQLQPLPDTTVKVNTTLIRTLSASDSAARIVKYCYRIDASPIWDTASSNTVKTVWVIADTGRHAFVVKAINADSVQSLPDTSIITVTYHRPYVRLHADTVIKINDTVRCTAQAGDSDGVIDHYLWSIDGTGTMWFTTQTDTLSWVFGDRAECFHTVRVAAVDSDGFVSNIDLVMIHVKLERPRVSLDPADTAIFADQNLKLKAMASDTNGTIAEYHWMLDGRLLPQSLKCDTVTLHWNATEAGTHLVLITVTDNDSLESLPDTVLVTVLPGMPIIAPIHDTTISSSDTLTITCHAKDPNGTIVKYLWNFSGAGWEDSTTDSSHMLFYSGKGSVKVVAGCRDNDGLVAADTFMVIFNRPPDSIAVSAPVPGDTIVLPQKIPSGAVVFAYSTHDPDNDVIVYSLWWKAETDTAFSLVYQGTNQSTQVAGVSPGQYVWRLEARDSWGHSHAKSGAIIVIREYRICFIGHSIVAGMGGDGIVGGFRGGVLDSLRKTLAPYERLKTVGPGITDFMKRSAIDDSSLALCSAPGSELYRALAITAGQLTADIWVLMTGVNDSYNPTGLNYAIMLIDVMRMRNPDSRIYVLNGVMLDPNSGLSYAPNFWLPSFNQGLTDAIAARDSADAHIFMVDANNTLCSNGQYDSTFFYFGDGLGIHPNQTGYDRLRDAIFSTMENSSPTVFLQKPEPYGAYRP